MRLRAASGLRALSLALALLAGLVPAVRVAAEGQLPPIVAAVYDDDTEEVAALIAQGVDVNVFQEGMDTPLVAALDREPEDFNLDMVKLLLGAKGIKVDKYSTISMGAYGWERTPLIAAAYRGHAEAVRLLLAKGAKVDLTDTHYPVSSIEGPKPRKTALIYAAEGGFDEVAVLLVAKGARIEWVSAEAITPVIAAASTVNKATPETSRAGHVRTLGFLLDKGARPDYCPESANTKYTTLELPPGTPASVPRRVRILGHGGVPALLLAAQNGFVEGIEVLLDHGANIESGGGDILRAATTSHQTATVGYLLDRGAKVDATDGTGKTSLLYAAQGLFYDTVELLLARGASVDAAGIDGATALMLSINQLRPEDEKESLRLMRLLLDHGADPDFQGATGNTALMYASGWGCIPKNPARAALLLEKGAKPGLANALGETALMHAASRGYLDIAKLLVSKGADVNARAKNGDTALSLAKRNDKAQVASFLASKGAKVEAAPARTADAGKAIVGAWEGLKNQNPYETHRFVFFADGSYTYEAGLSAAFKKDFPDPAIQQGYAANVKTASSALGKKGTYSFRNDALVLKPELGLERLMGWRVDNGKLYLNGLEFTLQKASK